MISPSFVCLIIQWLFFHQHIFTNRKNSGCRVQRQRLPMGALLPQQELRSPGERADPYVPGAPNCLSPSVNPFQPGPNLNTLRSTLSVRFTRRMLNHQFCGAFRIPLPSVGHKVCVISPLKFRITLNSNDSNTLFNDHPFFFNFRETSSYWTFSIYNHCCSTASSMQAAWVFFAVCFLCLLDPGFCFFSVKTSNFFLGQPQHRFRVWASASKSRPTLQHGFFPQANGNTEHVHFLSWAQVLVLLQDLSFLQF